MTENRLGGPGASASAEPSEPAGPAEPRVCAGCGAVTTGEQGLTWICSVEHGVRRFFCDTCSRTHLRSIEGRLDSDWL